MSQMQNDNNIPNHNLNYLYLIMYEDNEYYNFLLNNTHMHDNINRNTIENLSLYDSNPIKMVISEEEKNKLTPIKYKNAVNKHQNTACFITHDDFQEEDDIIQLPCLHCFNCEPILHWLTEESADCPVCRYKFESVEERKNDSTGPVGPTGPAPQSISAGYTGYTGPVSTIWHSEPVEIENNLIENDDDANNDDENFYYNNIINENTINDAYNFILNSIILYDEPEYNTYINNSNLNNYFDNID